MESGGTIGAIGGTFDVPVAAAGTGGGEGAIFFSDPFQVREHENIEIRVRSTGTNFWLGIDGDLVDEQSGVVQEFSLPIEYYEGVSDGESWTEGSRERSGLSLGIAGRKVRAADRRPAGTAEHAAPFRGPRL